MPELCVLGKKNRLWLLLAGKGVVLAVGPSQQDGCVSVSVDGGTVSCTMPWDKGKEDVQRENGHLFLWAWGSSAVQN